MKKEKVLLLSLIVILSIIVLSISLFPTIHSTDAYPYKNGEYSLFWQDTNIAEYREDYCINKEEQNYEIEQYCDGGECIPDIVFDCNLPEPPENLETIAMYVRMNEFSYLSDFGEYPDENYYKWPQFYVDMWNNCKYYYAHPQHALYGEMGTAPYPGEWIISVPSGEEIEIFFFWRAGCSIVKYQGFNLDYDFPPEGIGGGGNIKVEQTNVEKYFNVGIDPSTLFLGSTFPTFKYNWMERIKLTLKVSSDTPKGWYCLTVFPTDASPEQVEIWKREYFGRLSRWLAGTNYNLFIEVV